MLTGFVFSLFYFKNVIFFLAPATGVESRSLICMLYDAQFPKAGGDPIFEKNILTTSVILVSIHHNCVCNNLH
jgi:hypothetical protein